MPGDGLRAVNVYAIAGPDGLVLIDSGLPTMQTREAMAAGLAKIGAKIGDIERFLITHVHHDHYFHALDIRREFGTRVTLGANERASLDAMAESVHDVRMLQVDLLRELGDAELAEKHLQSNEFPWPSDEIYPDDWFVNGERVSAAGRELDLVETPGHTHGHVVFYDTPARLLFAGDHVLPWITPSIGFEPAMVADPLGDFLNSLAIVRARPDAMLLPAHGPVAVSTHARVDELLDHHRHRLDAMVEALGWGAETPYEVATKVAWTRRELTYADLDPLNQFLAVAESAAHLTVLAAQGRATQTMRDGVRCYALVAN
jgi:glyoxylase-like metal-dependent hydrolase (beta-lactamase superfamily II)